MGSIIHLVLHVAVPALVAWFWARRVEERRFVMVLAVLLLTMLVDLDHLLADPIYDPGRCSIGFHPLHTWPAILGYGALTLWRPGRVVGVGLLIHMALDGVDCLRQAAG